MAATTAGALKAWLEAGSLGISFFRDRAPKDQALPFGVIQEAISIVPIPMGDHSDQTADRQVTEQAQVSIYEVWRDATGKPAERYDLPSLVYRRLEGALLVDGPHHGRVKVIGARRQPDVEGPNANTGTIAVDSGTDGANVVANHFTVAIRRDA
jgi:hypothetical protein